MIVTKNWLSEFIDLEKISAEKLCLSLNEIGLEVDSLTSYKMPNLCVVGFIEEKIAHPNADKLSVCKVNVGAEVIQIVCGAKNVEKGQFVPVSLVGSVLPNGLEIKPTKLRDIESNGMICSSAELGFPKTNDGIMILGHEKSNLKAGTLLCDIKELNDDVIEIELTANRGDCLSIHGVARDLSVALDLKMDLEKLYEQDDILTTEQKAIVITLNNTVDASLIYSTFLMEEFKTNYVVDLRVAMIGSNAKTDIDKALVYATHTTGVILKAYKPSAFLQNKDKQINIILQKESNGLDALWGEKLISYIGISQDEDSKATDNEKEFVIEASYVDPEWIAKNGARSVKGSDAFFYNSLRGSEPNLKFGINFLSKLLNKTSNLALLSKIQQQITVKEQIKLNINFEDINEIIGQEIAKNDIVDILTKLYFIVKISSDSKSFSVFVPYFRHDIKNMQDICEEIVRIVGIDNIKSKALYFTEKNRINSSYYNFEKRKLYRHKSVAAGFFESVHYIFDDRAKMEEFGFDCIDSSKDLVNPITVELNTLRTTLILGLLEAASKNKKSGKDSIKLFEVGRVFDKNREENTKITFLISGDSETPCIINHGKPKAIDFFTFASKVNSVLGDLNIKASTPKNKIFSSYEYGNLFLAGQNVGVIARVHPSVESKYDLDKTYICEVEFDKLFFGRKVSTSYSKLPCVSRDLSLLMEKDVIFSKIKECIKKIDEKALQNFYPIDIYEDESLQDKKSMTITLIFQPQDKTFVDEDINKMVAKILKHLHEEINVQTRDAK